MIKYCSKKYYNPSKTLVVPSEKLKKIEETYGVECPIQIIPTGIDLAKYQKKISKKEKVKLLTELGLADSGKYLVTVCRLAVEKNLDELISYMPDLLAKDNEIKLIIVGDGPYRKKLEKTVAKMRLQENVIFAGMVAFDDVYKYYQLGNVFVCASTSESQGLTYIEALAARLPLACRKDECLNEIILPGKNGYIFSYKKEYIEGVLKILDNKALVEKMGKKSFELSDNFGREKFGKRLRRYIRACWKNARRTDVCPKDFLCRTAL